MKLFLREHLPLIIMTFIQLLAVILVFWLDGYNRLPVASYALFIGLCIFISYLVYRYISHKAFYTRLSADLERLEDLNQSYGNTPLSIALSQLFKKQYAHYIERLSKSNQQRSDHLTFINQWVHQMKTPLSVIELTVQEEDDERFVSIREEVDKIEKGLEMVLYAARLEVFEHDFQVQPVSLKNIVSQAIHENKRLFIKNHVYPEMKIDETLVVESDEKWLTFILNQLITNAVKYSTGKSDKLSIVGFSDGKKASIEVRDQGVGIPKSDVRRVFNPFYTGENGRVYRESTGMGLYLVKEVCTKLGHYVELESEVGIGTTMRVIFSTDHSSLTNGLYTEKRSVNKKA